MKTLLPTLALLVPGAAVAQTWAPPSFPGVQTQPSMNGPNYTTSRVASEQHELSPRTDTPAMQRQKLKRAIALREEARRRQAADGGTLSPKSLRYLQRKADAILSGRS